MKTPHDPRHRKRQRIVQELFSVEFHAQKVSETTRNVFEQRVLLDKEISKAAPEFPVEKINRIDLAILRLAVYEMLIEKKAPKNVIIDEAVELAKEYAGETSPAFINGALGNIATYENTPDIQ